MLEVLEFIFSSFWVWLGTLVLVAATSNTIGNTLIQVAKAGKK